MKRIYTAVFAIATAPRLFAGAFVLSDTDNSATDSIVSTLPSLEVLSRKDPKSVSASIPFHSIDSRKFKSSGITDISDALRRLPGINLRDYGGAGGLKTVSVRGLGARHTGVSYDGVALSDMRSGEIDLSKYSLENVSSVALIAGDADDIFIPARNSASGASIDISSIKNPDYWDSKLTLDARLKGGSFGLINPYLRAGFSNGNNFSIAGMADFTHAKNDFPFHIENGIASTRERRENSMMNSLHTELNTVYIPKPGSNLAAKIYYYDNNRRLPGPVVLYVNESHERLHDRNFFAQTRYRSRLSDIFSISTLAKFNWSSSHYQDEGGSYPGGKLDQNYLQREVYASASLLALVSDKFSLDYSADWFFNNLSSNLPSDSHPYRHSILQALAAKYSAGPVVLTGRLLHSLYLDRWKNSDPLSATESKKDFHRFSPSLSISVRPMPRFPLYFRASYRNIFRMPTFNELYFDNYGSVALRPEKTDQWNLGTALSLQNKGCLKTFSVSVDLFYNTVTDKIVAIPYNLFKFTMTNLGKARILGMESTINAEITVNRRHSFEFSATWTYQRAQPRTSPDMLDWMKQVAYTPLNSGSASLCWLNPWVSTAVHTVASSARYTTNSNLPSTRLGGYAETGIAFFHTFPLKDFILELRADIINLFDRQYQIVARYPMPGRNWNASIKFTF